jgi:hypothetical protein
VRQCQAAASTPVEREIADIALARLRNGVGQSQGLREAVCEVAARIYERNTEQIVSSVRVNDPQAARELRRRLSAAGESCDLGSFIGQDGQVSTRRIAVKTPIDLDEEIGK